jgi:hypothetical protein
MSQNPRQDQSLWGLVGIIAWEFLSYPLVLILVVRWMALRWNWPIWTVALAGFAGFGIAVWRLTTRFKGKP